MSAIRKALIAFFNSRRATICTLSVMVITACCQSIQSTGHLDPHVIEVGLAGALLTFMKPPHAPAS